jgi:RimJ/RimL family protein N-acetyltransferase
MDRLEIPAGWLMLRPFTHADIPWVHQVSQDPVLQHYTDVPSPYLLEHAAYFVQQLAIATWDSGQRAEFVVTETATGERLGRIGLGLHPPGAAEIGYWTGASTRQRGVATHAARAICGWGFTTLGLDIIEWHAEVGNLASRRVAEKAGFLVEATLRQRHVRRGQRVDVWAGSLLKDEYQP